MWHQQWPDDPQAVLAIGNALNVSTLRGGAQGFQLDALMKVSCHFGYGGVQQGLHFGQAERYEDDQRWAKLPHFTTLPSPSSLTHRCILDYLYRGTSKRGSCCSPYAYLLVLDFCLTIYPVSVDTIFQTADTFQLGLQKIQSEIKELQASGVAPNDRFIAVMEVSELTVSRDHVDIRGEALRY